MDQLAWAKTLRMLPSAVRSAAIARTGPLRWNAREADGDGYDISSFEPNGTPICIEVKTTTLDGDTPFYVSRNELLSSRELGSRYRLYRVSNFLSSPTVTIYCGALEDCMELIPNSYRAKPRLSHLLLLRPTSLAITEPKACPTCTGTALPSCLIGPFHPSPTLKVSGKPCSLAISRSVK